MYRIIPVTSPGRRLAVLSSAPSSDAPGRSSHAESASPAGPSVAVADTRPGEALLRKLFWGAAASAIDTDPDVCAHLFGICRILQAEHLEARGIACSFDVEPGRLPKPICDGIGQLVRALIMDAAEHALTGVGDKTIAVSLHRRGTLWVCSIAHSGGRVTRSAGPRSWRAIAETHAAELKASFRTRSTHQGTITAVLIALDRSGNLPVSMH
jgi:hypothetical protein